MLQPRECNTRSSVRLVPAFQFQKAHDIVVVAGAVGMSIAAFTTVLRLALRARKLWWDDALAFAGLVFLLTTGVAGKIYYSINGA